MAYYKVVLRKNKKLYSSFAHKCNYIPIRYQISKWVESKDLKEPYLFVTGSLKVAKNILRQDIEQFQKAKGSIYECEVDGINNEMFLNDAFESRPLRVKLVKRVKM